MKSKSEANPKRKISRRQIEANRRNGKRGGPKTTEGKSRVRHNALKHGLLAKEVVIQSGEGQEDIREFSELLDRLYEEHSPDGVMEEFCVERIAALIWRMRRSLRAEIGEIRLKIDSITSETFVESAKKFEFSRNFSIGGSNRIDLMDSSLGNQFLLIRLEDAKSLVENTGGIPDDSLEEFRQYLGCEQGSFTFQCFVINAIYDERTQRSAPEEKSLNDGDYAEMKRKALLRVIDKEIKQTEEFLEINRERDKMRIDATILQLNIPSRESVFKLMRYETAIDRQLFRSIQLLEYYQAKRSGSVSIQPLMQSGNVIPGRVIKNESVPLGNRVDERMT